MRWLPTLLILAAGSSAVASDGIIEINATRALVGGITPGDAPGYPVQIRQPGSYRLTGNLDVSGLSSAQNVTAISIESTDVELDLAGFAIIGPSVCGGFPYVCAPTGSGTGIRSADSDRVAVRNGTVRGFGNLGVFLQADAKVNGLTVSNCAKGGISAGTGSLISANVVTLTGGTGIQADSGVIRDNTVRASVIAGIRISASATVLNNTVAQTQPSATLPGVGISAAIGSSTVTGNTVTGNQGLGMSMSPTTGFSNNVITGNSGFGDTLQTSGGVQIGANLCGTDTICP